MTTYSQIIEAARNACGATYVRAGGNVDDVWTVKAEGATASIARRVVSGGRVHWDLALPLMPLDARLSKAEGDQVTAYWLHEGDHALFTDFAVWDQALREGLAQIVNGLEDPRIEREADRANVASNHRGLIHNLITGMVLDGMADGWTPGDALNLPFTLAVYGRVALTGLHIPGLPDYRDHVDARTADTLDECFRRLAKTRHGKAGTADVLDIARWLVRELGCKGTPRPPVQQSPKGGKGDGQGQDGRGDKGDTAEGDKGEGDAPGKGDKGDKGEGDKGEGDAPQGEGDKGEGDAPQGGKGDKGDAPDAQDDGASQGASRGTFEGADPKGMASAEPSLSDLAERVNGREDRDPTMGDRTMSRFQRVPADDIGVAMAGLSVNKRGVVVPAPKTSSEQTAEGWTAQAGPTGKLRHDIARMVKAPERAGKLHNQAAGRLDRHALGRAMAGADNVFLRRQDQEGETTAVLLALDISSSMSAGGSARAAGTMALLIGDALSGAGAPFAVAGFADPPGTVVSVGGVGTKFLMAKPFNAPWRARRGSVVRLMTQHLNYGTHIAPAIMEGANMLREFKGATRRLLFVLTDGQDGYGLDASRVAVKLAQGMGVETVGLGIGTDLDRAIYGDLRVTVNDPSDVARAGLGLLVKALERGRARR